MAVFRAWCKWLAGRLFTLLPLFLPLYLRRFHIASFPTTILEAMILLLVVLFTIGYGFGTWAETIRSLGRLRWWMLAWLVVTFGEIFVSLHPMAGLGLWRAYVLEPMLVGLMAFHLFRANEAQRVSFERSSYVLVCVLAIVAIGQFFFGWDIPSPWDTASLLTRRATSVFPYPNALALIVAPIGAWGFSRFLSSLLTLHMTRWREALVDAYRAVRDTLRARKPWRFLGFTFGAHADWLAGLAWVGAIVCVLLAKSEGGGLALLVGFFLALILEKRGRPMAIVIGAIGALTLILWADLRAVIWHQITFQGWSGRVRVWMWADTWRMLKDHPLFGAGFGGYPALFASYHLKPFIEIFQYPHNILLNFWSETGIAGVVTFAALVVTWGREAWRKGRWLLVPLAAILVHGLVDVPYFKNDLAVWFWMALMFVVSLPNPPLLDRLVGRK